MMTAAEIIGLLVGALTLVTAILAAGKWLGRREGAESEAKTATRMSIQEMRTEIGNQARSIEKIDSKLDTITALVVKVDRVEADQRDTRAKVDDHETRLVKLEAKETP
jgi:hypothetical protein